MFANPVFITPGRFTYVTKIEQSYLYLATKITISKIVSIENQFKNISTGNPNVVLGNKIISCYLPSVLPESL